MKAKVINYWKVRPETIKFSEWYSWADEFFDFTNDDLNDLLELEDSFQMVAKPLEEIWARELREHLRNSEFFKLFPEIRNTIKIKLNELPETISKTNDPEARDKLIKEYKKFVYMDSPIKSVRIEDVKPKVQIEDIIGMDTELRLVGKNYSGKCPFHKNGKERRASFHVYPDSQSWWCFACGEGGDVINYIMKKENLTFSEALNKLTFFI